MSITDKAKRAASEEEAKRAALVESGAGNPQDKRYIPQGESWDRFEANASRRLTDLLGEDPGPAQRIEPNSWRMREHGHQYPARLQRQRLCVFYPDGHEVVVAPGGGAMYVVRRSANPMEEAMVAPFRTLAEFGEAIE